MALAGIRRLLVGGVAPGSMVRTDMEYVLLTRWPAHAGRRCTGSPRFCPPSTAFDPSLRLLRTDAPDLDGTLTVV